MRILPVSLALLLSACALTPPLARPDPALPEAYADSPDAAGNAADLGWRQMFGDPRLQRLITIALDNNRDLRIAMLNVDAVRAQYGIERSALLPQLDARLSGGRERTAANGASAASLQGTHAAGLAISAFEIDLFGRVRALSDAALARYLASTEAARAARISLIAAVADAYLEERLAIEQLRLTETTLADWRQSLDLARLLKDAKQNSGLDVAQAEGQVALAEADLEGRKRDLKQARNALALLLGTSAPSGLPGGLPEGLPEGLRLDKQPVLTSLPAGLPSDLLLRRPDILQAEQALRAANADVGAARAAFFPRLALTATLGYASPALGSLFQGGQLAWGFTPQLIQPLFDNGRLESGLDLARARRSTAVAEYEKSIQTAFREVADGLAAQATLSRQIEAQQRAVSSAERRRELSSLRYRAGQDSRLELLDAQRQAYAAQQTLLGLQRLAFRSAVSLYKALGGGLQETTAAAT
ncbi:MAG: efflux transporter outer membrane subunit [Zoogloea sp.]|nr:efflux transporter outer membrane subunit [Zoogloea sp.]MCA0187924.1 efflux transporter outer membrane subunit [Pseudomonadota bacterium]